MCMYSTFFIYMEEKMIGINLIKGQKLKLEERAEVPKKGFRLVTKPEGRLIGTGKYLINSGNEKKVWERIFNYANDVGVDCARIVRIDTHEEDTELKLEFYKI